MWDFGLTALKENNIFSSLKSAVDKIVFVKLKSHAVYW